VASLDVARPARATPAHLTRELEVRERLPYAHHLTDRIIRLDNGALMMSFRLDGASYEPLRKRALAA
jgi:type IV secretory pathway VirB4 component